MFPINSIVFVLYADKEPSQTGIFANKTFRLLHFDEESIKGLREIIIKEKGM